MVLRNTEKGNTSVIKHSTAIVLQIQLNTLRNILYVPWCTGTFITYLNMFYAPLYLITTLEH